MRGLVGAALLFAWVRPNVRGITATQWRAIVPYGLALGVMVLAIYLALADTPLGIVSAILMLGPLTVSAIGYRTPIDLAGLWRDVLVQQRASFQQPLRLQAVFSMLDCLSQRVFGTVIHD